MKRVKLILLALAIFTNVFAQQSGSSFITNFQPAVYKAHSQNWAVVQDKRGVLFFGNGSGILEYDGITWQLHPMDVVRSLAMDNNGRIYVGLRGDFGYLQPDSLGNLQYKSLKDKIPAQDLEFNEIWSIFTSENKIYFSSFQKIFIYENEKLKVINPKKSFHLSFLVKDDFYVRDVGTGLMKYENDRLKLVEGGEQFADESIFVLLPYKQNELFIVSRTKGLTVYSPNEASYYKPTGFEAVEKYLNRNIALGGTVLMNGAIALRTYTGGVIVFNNNGSNLETYNSSTGLQDNTIWSLFSDKNQQLWACTNNGISLIQYNLPFKQYSEKNGLKGKPYCIGQTINELYIGTSQYLCVQNAEGNFETIPGTEGQNWQLRNFSETLLLANSNGLFEITDNKAFRTISNAGFYSLGAITGKPDSLLAGFSTNGLCLLAYNKKNWEIKTNIKGFTKPVYEIIQDKDGSFWVYTNSELYKIALNQHMDSVISIMQGSVENGLPNLNARPYLLNSGEVVFGTRGVYRYNTAKQRFEVHPDFNLISSSITGLQQQKNGDIWFEEATEQNTYEKGVLKYDAGKYTLFKQPFYKFNEDPSSGYFFYTADADSTLFFGTLKGLLQYNPNRDISYDLPFKTLIRKVFAKDSLLFGGAMLQPSEVEYIKGNVLPYSQNNLVFQYAAAFYEDVEKNLYSYRLVGSDTAWSAWGTDVKKEYTNLTEGVYIFEVRAMNQYKILGNTASYWFRILPPWYRAWWAFTLYVLSFISLAFLVLKTYTRRLVAQKEHLEQVVKERTHEILEKNEELQQQKEEITQTLEIVSNQKEEIQTQAQLLEKTNSELEKLSIVASETDSAVVIMDSAGNIEWTNKGFERLYGLLTDESIKLFGKNILEVSTNTEIGDILDKCKNDKTSVIYESQTKNKNNETIWLQTTLTPILDSEHNITKLIAIDSDIRKLKKYEKELKLKNEQISASIRYAQTIQQAILPVNENLDLHFENFILFHPKDIVSGDFYWYIHIPLETKDLFFIAAADCTGHGVPGAFMSMICSRLLNEAVNEKGIYEPNEILEEVDKNIRIALKQDQDKNSDGMDICLICIENENQNLRLKFCGAKRPLFYFSNQTAELVELKADRRSIGGSGSLKNKVNFTTQEITVSSNDVIYLSTDGYTDQNNNLRKRLGTAKLTRIFKELGNKPLQEQKEYLENYLTQYMGAEEQRDDITIIGVRFNKR